MTPSPESDKTRRWVVLVLVAGAAFRLVHYVLNPSLGIDDLMMSVSVVSRGWAGLTHVLAFLETAPVGFLWTLRASVLVGGPNEFALRAIPLLAGIAVPYGVWQVGRRLLSPAGAALAATFAALSQILIQYSISAKPYETDALVTVAVLLATLAVFESPTPRRWIVLGVLGAVAITCSTPSVFVLAAGWIALAAGKRESRQWAALSVMGGVWAALFALVYFTVMRREAVSTYMQTFWDHRFLTPGTLIADPARVWDIVKRIPTQAFTGDTPHEGALLLCWSALLVGLVRLGRQSWFRVALLAGPIAVALAASTIRRYPVSPRLFVFAAPLVLLIAAAGFEAAWERWRAGLPAVTVRGIAVLWLVVLVVLDVNVSRLWPQPTRVAVSTVMRGLKPKEPLYLFPGAVPAWLFYSLNWRDPGDTALAADIERAERLDGNAFQNASSRGSAVDDTEGTHLVWTRGGHPIVVGLAPGITWREGQWFSQEEPDRGWAEREAARIDGVTDSTAWLMFANVYRSEVLELTHALAGRRAAVVSSENNRGAMLYRVRFTR